MIKNYFKIAFRSFWKHKLLTLINIIGLSIGITASIAIYLIVHYDLTFDKFHRDSDRIYRIVSNFSSRGSKAIQAVFVLPLQVLLKHRLPVLSFRPRSLP